MAYENAFITIMHASWIGVLRIQKAARIGKSNWQIADGIWDCKIRVNKVRTKRNPRRYLASNNINSDILDQLYWAKLEKAALSAGIQDPKHLTDEELVHAFMSYLEGTWECNNQHLSCKWWRGSGRLRAVRVKSIVYICGEGKKSIHLAHEVEGYDE